MSPLLLDDLNAAAHNDNRVMTKMLHRLIQSTRRFASIYWWVFNIHLRPNWKWVTLIIILSCISAGAQGGVIGFIAFSLDVMENPNTYGFDWFLEGNRVIGLIILGTVVGAIAAFGAFANYGATRTARAMGRSFHELCATRTLHNLALLHTIPDSLSYDEPQLIRLVSRNGMLLGRTVQACLNVIEPVLRFAVALGILIYIDVRISLVLIPLVLLMIPGLLRIGTRVKSTSESYFDVSAPEMGRHARNVIVSVNNQDMFQGDDRTSRFDSSFIDDVRVQKYLDEYDTVNLANARMRLFMNGASSTVLGFALIGSGYLAMTGFVSWPVVMVLLIALWTMQRALVQCGSLFAIMNLFYPFVAQTKAIISMDDATDSKPVVLPIRLMTDSDNDEVTIDTGDRIGMISDMPLDRLHLYDLLSPIAEHCNQSVDQLIHNLAFVTDRYRPLDSCVHDALDSIDDHFLDRLSVRSLIDTLDSGMDTVLTSELWNEMPIQLKTAICLAPTLCSQQPIVVIDARMLRRLPQAIRESYFSIYSNRILILHSNNTEPMDSLVDMYIAVADKSFIGFGDRTWVESLMPTLNLGDDSMPQKEEDDDAILMG